MNYLDSIKDKHREYLKILSPDFPLWLNDYIMTEAMQRIGYISYDNGNDYLSFTDKHEWFSNLDHSVSMALMVWHFTHDKKQTLAALFHDIATPVFKHCIDYMNGDSEKQESTEERTEEIIRGDKGIMALLKRDGIKVEEVCNYKIYPICDNEVPQLSCDRFEYNFSCGYFIHPEIWTLDEIRKTYNDIRIMTNEEGKDELGFQTLKIAENYIHHIVNLWPYWMNPTKRIILQFYADICSLMNEFGYLSIDDLYSLKEIEVVNKIKNCPNKYIREAFDKFSKLTSVNGLQLKPSDYTINVKTKRRYVNPLIANTLMYGRVYDLSDKACLDIERFMEMPVDGIVSVDLDYSKEKVRKLTNC